MLRETVPIHWGRLHTEFWVMASSTPNFRLNRQPFRANNQGRKFLGRTCWTDNRRGFCGDQSCSFQHKCGYCRGAHPAQSCGQQGRRHPMGSNPGNQQQNSGQINLTHSPVPPICTSVKFGKPKTLLQGYPAKKYILEGFLSGFHFHYSGLRVAMNAQNLKSCQDFPDIVLQKITSEINAGRVKGPFSHPPFITFKVSPISLVPKKNPG